MEKREIYAAERIVNAQYKQDFRASILASQLSNNRIPGTGQVNFFDTLYNKTTATDPHQVYATTYGSSYGTKKRPYL